jgi:hypothetical protein
MAFADVLVTESEASVLIIDRYAKPGGHWNVAYPFVELHQPAAFYGVSSKELSGGRQEWGGLNDGLGELASGAQVSAYFDDVMRHQFLPSGRVRYFPSCDYRGEGRVVSQLSGEQFHVKATKKLIDCTHLNTEVPSTHTPNFAVAEGVRFMPLNDLPRVTEPPEGFVVIGAGKTGIDACLWLLGRGVNPDAITWIVSRDAWLLDRRNTQVTDEFFLDTMGLVCQSNGKPCTGGVNRRPVRSSRGDWVFPAHRSHCAADHVPCCNDLEARNRSVAKNTSCRPTGPCACYRGRQDRARSR